MEDYLKSMVVYGNYDGVLAPVMVDSEGRLIYLSNDWKAWEPVCTAEGIDDPTFYTECYYKRMGGLIFFTAEVHISADSGTLTDSTISAPVSPGAFGQSVYSAKIRHAIIEGEGWTDYFCQAQLPGVTDAVIEIVDFPSMSLVNHQCVIWISGQYPTG